MALVKRRDAIFSICGIGVAAKAGRLRSMTEEERLAQAQQRLDAATQHLMMLPQFPSSEADVDALKSRLRSDYRVHLWVTPYRGDSGLPIIYAIKAGGLYHDIKLLYRQATEGSVLEFWIVQIVGDDWTGIANRIEFKVVEVDSMGMRRILLSEDQFRTTIPLPDGRTLTLPAGDEEFLYRLNTTGFPKNFRESGLSEIEIYIDENGQYQRR